MVHCLNVCCLAGAASASHQASQPARLALRARAGAGDEQELVPLQVIPQVDGAPPHVRITCWAPGATGWPRRATCHRNLSQEPVVLWGPVGGRDHAVGGPRRHQDIK